MKQPASCYLKFWRAIITLAVAAPLFGGSDVTRPPAVHAPLSGTAPARRLGQLKPCKVPNVEEELLGGKFTVYENRRTRTGRTIDLNVIVLPALDPIGVQEPLFELAGGPGIAITRSAVIYATDMKEYRRHRDVVLVDQRGTGESNPLQAEHDSSPQAFLGEMYPVAYVQTLRARLEQKADLTQYTTPIAMDDLDDVRAWLGYERINLYGLSYGTRAALVYLRQHPAHVRSVILMSVAPTFMQMPRYFARDGQRALNLLLDECARDPVAGPAFPRLREELGEVLTRLEHQPARVRYAKPDQKIDVMVEISREVFAEKLREQLYLVFRARKIPRIIHEAALGNFGPFLEVAIPADRTVPDFIADGMYLCVTSAEDTPFIDLAAAEKQNAGNIFGNYRVFQQTRAGRLWPRGQIPEGYEQPVRSDVPALLISGNMDPVTPPVWAEEVARYLPNSRHVVLAHGAHLPDGLSHFESLDKLMMDFLDAGDARQLDVTPLEQMLPPPFVTQNSK